ncbi:MAG: ATP synthase F1 subunit epsilon [Thermoanaerobaculia bacterium]
MDGKLTLTLVTPEHAVLEKVSCTEVNLPALDGQIGILPGHTPLITLLGIGTVTYRDGGKKTSVAVRDGFAEIVADVVRVLADRAATRETIDAAAVTREKDAAEKSRLEVVGEEELAAASAEVAFAEARLQVVAAT